MKQDLEIKTLNLQEAWNIFKTEVEMTDPEYKKARFGIKIKFDINDYLKNRIVIKTKTGKVFLRGKIEELEEFETELELREREVKDYLIENMVDEDLTSPRGIE